MEVNAENIFAKYSKLVEDNPKKDNETQETMDKHKAEKLVLAWFEHNDPPITKEKQGKMDLKTLVGLSIVILMIFTGLASGLIIMDMKIKQLEHQNQNLVQDLRSQEKISHDLRAKNQNLSTNLEDMTNALVLSEFEIGDLKEEIQNLILKNQKLIDDFESKHQSLEHYQELHQNCTKEQELGRDLIKDLKLQNQNLTKDLGNIDSTRASLKNLISYEQKTQILLKASKNGEVDQVRLVLNLGANVNSIDFEDHHSKPLHHAAKNGHSEIAELLLENEADVNAKDNERRTPLHLAAGYGHPKIVKILLKHGARKDVKDYFDYTPLKDAKYYKRGNYQQVIELLQNS